MSILPQIMCRKLTIIILSVLAMTAFAGASAVAQPTVVDQYTEGVPTAGGEEPRNETQKPGANGRTQNTVIGSSDDSPSGNGEGGSEQGSGSSDGSGSGPGSEPSDSSASSNESAPVQSSDNESAPVQSSDAENGSSKEGGMGLLFPLILVGVFAAAVTLFFIRRRGDSGSRAA